MPILFDGSVRIIITIIISAIILWILFRYRVSKRMQKGSLAILKERRDRGEISEEAYEAAKRQQIKK